MPWSLEAWDEDDNINLINKQTNKTSDQGENTHRWKKSLDIGSEMVNKMASVIEWEYKVMLVLIVCGGKLSTHTLLRSEIAVTKEERDILFMVNSIFRSQLGV